MTRPFLDACIGGTFQAMHAGHQRYIDIAFGIAEHVHIWLSSTVYARSIKPYPVSAYSDRRKRLVAYLEEKGYSDRVTVRELNEHHAVREFLFASSIDVVVVEPKYFIEFTGYAEERELRGHDPMCVLLKFRTTEHGIDLSSRTFVGSADADDIQSN